MKRLIHLIMALMGVVVCGLVLLSCGLSDNGTNHECSYEQSVVGPTCTRDGYIEYRCSCGKFYTETGEPALGHDFPDEAVFKDATCTESGGMAYICKRCPAVKIDEATLIKPYGHSLVTDEAVAATCSKMGLTEGSHCKICNVVLVRQNTVAKTAHLDVVEDEAVEATCKETGLSAGSHCGYCNTVIVRQTVIEKGDHVDSDHDGVCDYCATKFDDITVISDVAGLRAIINDLGGKYSIAQDISLSGADWVSLGTAQIPFSGTLYGNNHVISGLSLSNKSEGGLFAYNAGTISGVCIKDFSLTMSNCNGTLGGIAAVNAGTIENCEIMGSNTYSLSVSTSLSTGYPSYDGSTVSYSAVIGGFSGVNTGTIKDCEITGTLSCISSNNCEYYLTPNGFFFLDSNYSHRCNSTFLFGGIAGKNSGGISDCKVSGATTFNIRMTAAIKNKGIAYAHSDIFAGSIVGTNEPSNASIKNCQAKKAVFTVSSSGVSISSNGYNGISCTVNRRIDQTYDGIIGANGGKIEAVTYL